MKILKTYRNDDEKHSFNKEIEVQFCSSDMSGKMHIAELLALTSDLAVEDFEDRKLDYIMLKEHGFAILLSRISYKTIRMPKEAEKIRISTWEEKAQGLQMVRKFEICAVGCDEKTDCRGSSTGGDSSTGDILIYGTTMWLLVDPIARRIMPPAKFDLRPVPQISSELKTLEPGKIRLGENAILAEKRKMNFSDCDPNGHVNNSRYGAFAIDVLYTDGKIRSEIESKTLTDFRLNYAKEAHCGDTLEIYISLENCLDGSVKIVSCGKNCGKVSSQSDTSENPETSFECEMIWR